MKYNKKNLFFTFLLFPYKIYIYIHFFINTVIKDYIPCL